MATENPIEISYLPGQLRNLFAGKVSESETRDAKQREANFLSRSLAAYAVHKLSGCCLDDAAKSVIDHGGDGGLDAFYYSHSQQIIWVVQSKFVQDGRGQPSLDDVTTFKNGLEFLLEGKFDYFDSNQSDNWKRITPTLNAAFKNAIQVCPVLVYSGIDVVSDDRLFLFDALKLRFDNEDDDYVDFQICNLTTIHDWLIGADIGVGVSQVELKILKPSRIPQPYETILGQIPLQALAQLHAEHDRELVAANIRYYKGETAANDEILRTIREEPEHFFYLNNGLTAYCDRLEVNNLDRTRSEFKRVTAHGFSIVNGAQTLGSIAEFFKTSPSALPEGNVFIKLVSLRRCADDRAFAERITRSSNFQNRVRPKDFVALDEQQARIANQLKLANITYHYKDDVEASELDDASFSLKEATTALACLAKKKDCDDFCARVLANRESLWSMDEVYSDDELLKTRYSRVFRPDRSARTVWRVVQVQRVLPDGMRNSGRAERSIRKAFFENARWVLLSALFIKSRLHQGEAISLAEVQRADVSRQTAEFAEELWKVCEEKGYVSRTALPSGGSRVESVRHFRSVFSSASDCKILRGALLAKLAQTGDVSS